MTLLVLPVDREEPRAAEHRHPTGAHDLLDADRLQELDQRVDLVLCARHLDDVRAPRHVDDLAAEDVDDVDDLAAGPLVHRDLDEHQLALDVGGVGEVDHLDDGDQLVKLLLDLLERLVVTPGDERDARDGRVHGLGDREALDVEAAAAEEPRDAREDAELVLDQNGDGVPHDFTATSGRDGATGSP
jgi:hypothetical protein